MTQDERVHEIERDRIDIEREHAKRNIAFVLRQSHLLKYTEPSEEFIWLPAGAKVLEYRTKTKKWEGTLKFAQIEGETVTIKTDKGPGIFRSTCIKEWTGPEFGNNTERKKQPVTFSETSESRKDKTYLIRKLRTKKEMMEREKTMDFKNDRRQDLKGWLDNQTFIQVIREDVPEGVGVFGELFIDELKKYE